MNRQPTMTQPRVKNAMKNSTQPATDSRIERLICQADALRGERAFWRMRKALEGGT